jgi:hypothetical protein
MPEVFSIDTAATSVALDGQRKGVAQFTVTNKLDSELHGRIRLEAKAPAAPAWFRMPPGAALYPARGSKVFEVAIAVPPEAKPGEYTFRLDAASERDPTREQTVGPEVKLVVGAGEIPRDWLRWWWVPVAIVLAGVMVYVGIKVFWPDEPPQPPPTELPIPEAPEPLPPLISSFSAGNPAIRLGDSVTLSWSVDPRAKVLLTDFAEVEPSGSRTDRPTADKTYILTAQQGDKTEEQRVTVLVRSTEGTWSNPKGQAGPVTSIVVRGGRAGFFCGAARCDFGSVALPTTALGGQTATVRMNSSKFTADASFRLDSPDRLAVSLRASRFAMRTVQIGGVSVKKKVAVPHAEVRATFSRE